MEALVGRCLGVGQEGVHRGAGLADGLGEFRGVAPSVDGDPVQAGGGGRADGGALCQRKRNLRLAGSERG